MTPEFPLFILWKLFESISIRCLFVDLVHFSKGWSVINNTSFYNSLWQINIISPGHELSHWRHFLFFCLLNAESKNLKYKEYIWQSVESVMQLYAEKTRLAHLLVLVYMDAFLASI